MKEQRPSGQDQDAARGDQDLNAIQNNDKPVNHDTYKKVVGEVQSTRDLNRKLKDQLAERDEKLKAHELSIAEAEGRKDDVIKQLREELSTVKGELKDTTTNYATSTVKNQIKLVASKHGCVNPTKLIKLLNKEDLNGIDINGDFQVNGEDLERIITKAKEEHSDIGLFGAKKVNVTDIAVSGMPTSKGVNEMSTAELKAAIKAARK